MARIMASGKTQDMSTTNDLMPMDWKASCRHCEIATTPICGKDTKHCLIDATALDAVRFRYFTSDCRHIAGDPAEVDNLIEQEKHIALDFLANTYKDIMDNFDPTVVKLRRKRQIILANDKLKDLL
jgi:hypothetical protein